MMTRTIAAMLLASAAVSGCAENYGGEGAAAGGAVGALVGAAAGAPLAGAAIGAAAGGAIGSTYKKNDGYCYRRDRDGYDHRVPCD